MADLEHMLRSAQDKLRGRPWHWTDGVKDWFRDRDWVGTAVGAMLWVLGLMAVALIVALPFIVWAVLEGIENDRRLVAQCIADGRKEYECEAMLRRSTTAVVPIPMPIVVR